MTPRERIEQLLGEGPGGIEWLTESDTLALRDVARSALACLLELLDLADGDPDRHGLLYKADVRNIVGVHFQGKRVR